MNRTARRFSTWSWVVSFLVLGAGVAVSGEAQERSIWTANEITVGRSVRNDVSPPLRSMTEAPVMLQPLHLELEPRAELGDEMMEYDPVVQDYLAPEAMPAPIQNFDGILFPGVACNCAPPDTDGEVGATQYVQMVNEGLQVFNKSTGASVLGPIGIATLWTGFTGVCETGGAGDPVVLYDQLANRWVVSQFAGAAGTPTDECVAVSTTSDATGTWFRYDFHLGTSFFDYPKLSVWPDAYYLAENVFNAAGTVYLGPQPFALDRAAMLTGAAAAIVTPGLQSTALRFMLAADLDGAELPPAGAPNPWLSTAGGTWSVYRFHVDFATPANSTWTLGGSLTPAGFTSLCAATRNCVPQLGTTDRLDGIGDRPMFRLAYRRFADGHEALVGNRSVSVSSVAGIRWWEINNATSGTPSFVQQATYQPDTSWRWLGSIAMDTAGNLALGFSASDATINPQLRYAGRLAGDPAGTLAQGEATLLAGTGSQTGTGNRWGDYSDLTVDPLDDCTFWYTNEYYSTTTTFAWRTRIGSFKFPGCSLSTTFALDVTVVGSGTVTSTPAGISCPGDCTENYLNFTPVGLTPAAAVGWQFTGWSGACTGTGACNVTMTQARAVSATFTQLFTLDVTVVGSGTVTSTPAGINCPGDCTEDYLDGTPVSLTPAAAAGWQFTGWSGACTGTGACNVTMSQARAVTATFTQLFTLDVTVVGSGTVTSTPAGINCPGDCTENYLDGTPVGLTPAASAGWQFTGWSGACTGTGACNVTMTQARAVSATFTQLFTLDVTVVGSGTVTSTPAGINCPGDCTENYLNFTPVSLTPAAAAGWQFTGWSGACTGTGACNVTMTQARAVSATFTQLFTLDVTVVGSGTVTSTPAGINCPGDCTESYLDGTPVGLTPAAAVGWQFTGWSGACTGTGACNVTMTQARAVTATFDTMPFLDGFESGDTSAWSLTVP